VTFEEGTCAAWLYALLEQHVTKIFRPTSGRWRGVSLDIPSYRTIHGIERKSPAWLHSLGRLPTRGATLERRGGRWAVYVSGHPEISTHFRSTVQSTHRRQWIRNRAGPPPRIRRFSGM
jgi:hypothetical protein